MPTFVPPSFGSVSTIRDVQGGRARTRIPGGTASYTHAGGRLAAGSVADFNIYVDMIFPNPLPSGNPAMAIEARRVYDALDLDTGNGYRAVLQAGTNEFRIVRVDGYTPTVLGTPVAFTVAAGGSYRVRFQGAGGSFRAKVWAVGTTEPTTWNIQGVSDSLYDAGHIQILTDTALGLDVDADFFWDNIRVFATASTAAAPVVTQNPTIPTTITEDVEVTATPGSYTNSPTIANQWQVEVPDQTVAPTVTADPTIPTTITEDVEVTGTNGSYTGSPTISNQWQVDLPSPGGLPPAPTYTNEGPLAPANNIHWMGLNWGKKSNGELNVFGDVQGTGGPGEGEWAASNVELTPEGYLRFRITNPTGTQPIGSEIITTRAGFGYGTYICVIQKANIADMHKTAVIGGLFTYEHGASNAAGQHNREIDFCETSAWAQAGGTVDTSHTYWINDWTNPPADTLSDHFIPSNAVGTYTHVAEWTSQQAICRSYAGVGYVGKTPVKTSTLGPDSRLFGPGNERLHFNFWTYWETGGVAWETATPDELTLQYVSFTPQGQTAPSF